MNVPAGLAERCQAGERQAFTELFQATKEDVYKIIYSVLGNDTEIEDIIQKVYLEIFKNISRFQKRSKISTWIYGITTHTCFNTLRQRKKQQQELSLATPAGKQAAAGLSGGQRDLPDRDIERQELNLIITACLKEIKPDWRVVLILHDMQHLPLKEISKIVSKPVGTIKSRLFYARDAMKTALQKRNISDAS